MRKGLLNIALVLLFLLIGKGSFAQINSSGVHSELVENSLTDSIFVFCSDEDNGVLIAKDSTGFGGYTFTWSKFDSVAKDFTIPISNFTINEDSSSSTIDDLANGGYRVRLIGDTAQEYIAWVYNYSMLSTDLIIEDTLDCEQIWLSADPSIETDFTYYNWADSTTYLIDNSIDQYSWRSEPASSIRDIDGSRNYMTNDVLDDTEFFVLVTDKFGCQVEESINYTAIISQAEFTVEVFNDEDMIFESNNAPDESAPAIVKFINSSTRAQDLRWFFGDTLWNNDIDTLYTDDLEFEPEHTYYYSNTYTTELATISPFGCRDSITLDIIIKDSQLEMPNVFTPNDDDENPVFKFGEETYSLRSMEITIYNRQGKKVYQYEGDPKDWEGWDGKTNAGIKAKQGAYFYVLRVEGWDNIIYDNWYLEGKTEGAAKGKKSGVIYLYR